VKFNLSAEQEPPGTPTPTTGASRNMITNRRDINQSLGFVSITRLQDWMEEAKIQVRFKQVATYPLEIYARINALTLLVIFESIPGTS
jgi:hypothetical protein